MHQNNHALWHATELEPSFVPETSPHDVQRTPEGQSQGKADVLSFCFAVCLVRVFVVSLLHWSVGLSVGRSVSRSVGLFVCLFPCLFLDILICIAI